MGGRYAHSCLTVPQNESLEKKEVELTKMKALQNSYPNKLKGKGCLKKNTTTCPLELMWILKSYEVFIAKSAHYEIKVTYAFFATDWP